MLEQIRAEEPDEPLWKGVKEMRGRDARRARDVRARDRPELYDTGGSQAACLLYRPT